MVATDIWCVTTIDCGGLPTTVLANSRDDAVSHFYHLTYLFLHAAPDMDFMVVGNDDDAALAGLHLLIKTEEGHIPVLSLTKPGQLEKLKGSTIRRHGDRPFVEIAGDLQLVIEDKAGNLSQKDIDGLSRSGPAYALAYSKAEGLAEEASYRLSNDDVEQVISHTWDDMRAGKHQSLYQATIL